MAGCTCETVPQTPILTDPFRQYMRQTQFFAPSIRFLSEKMRLSPAHSTQRLKRLKPI